MRQLTPEIVVTAYEEHKARERSRRSIATSNWPTVLAHPCEAYAVYNRIVPGDQRRKIGSDLAMIFSEGNDQARMVKRDLIDAGFEVSGEEEQMSWPKFQISGRRDLLVWKEGFKEKVRVEVKSCSPWTFEAINSVTDLMETQKGWLAKWWKQVALYMVLQGVSTYWMLLKNKQSGKIKIIPFELTDTLLEAAEAMLKRAERVNHLIQIGAMPGDDLKIADREHCTECEFFSTCLPNLAFGPGLSILTEEDAMELSLLLDRRAELEGAATEYDEVDKEAKATIKVLNENGGGKLFMAGEWIATVKESARKAYSVPAMTTRRIDFSKTKEGKNGSR